VAANLTVLTLIKDMAYRAEQFEEFSNSYIFKAPTPVNTTEWTSLMNQIVGLEQPIYDAGVRWVRAVGHGSTDPGAVALFEHDFLVPGPPPIGSFADVSGRIGAGDQASCVEWSTDRKSIRGKTIYLRKYHHHPHINATVADDLSSPYVNALSVYAGSFSPTTPWGGLTNTTGLASVAGNKVIPYVTTRTLKRRGRRKKVA